MTALFYGLQVMVVGLLIVFAGLTILIGCIKGMEKVMERLPQMQGKLSAGQMKEKPGVNPNKAAQPEATGDDTQLVAVITAAVAAMLAQENAAAQQSEEAPEEIKGFVVRSIRRVSNAPAWNSAGREEQIYSSL